MKKTIDVKNADALFENIKSDNAFNAEEKSYGLNIKYNGVFGLLASPKINIIKLDENSVKIIISSNLLLKLTATFFTLFFWTIAVIAIIKSKLNTFAIIGVFLLPSVMWILNLISSKKINEMILDDIEKYDL